MDWLKALETFGTSFLYPALKSILKLGYIVTIPLHYPIYYLIYYLLTLVAFLLSPIWYMLHSVSTATLAVVGLVSKLKYLYIYLACAAIIGICAGCVLHGTSSFIFLSLGVHTSQEQDTGRPKLPPLDDEDQDWYDPEFGSRTESSSSKLSITPRRPKTQQGAKDEAHEILEKQWKLLRSSDKPRRRRRGLLSQTIHEESSSDFS